MVNAILPTEELLSSISYRTSLNMSLRKSLSKVDKDLLFSDLELAIEFLAEQCFLMDYQNRVKSLQSCKLKCEKNLLKGNNIKIAFNDLFGIRIIVNEYQQCYPSHFRVVNMTKGKKNDDDYRGVHLYYQKDNYHYPIGIQLNTPSDRLFADLTHKHLYKKVPNELAIVLRDKFDNGLILDEKDFLKEIEKYDKGNNS